MLEHAAKEEPMPEGISIEVRDYINERVHATERLCEAKLQAHDELSEAKLAAMGEVISANMRAAERAAQKAEEAQHEYNIRSNEFRAQLKDQADMLMPRAETLTLFKSSDEKMASAIAVADDKLREFRRTYEERHEILRQQVEALRTFQSSVGAKDEGSAKTWLLITSVVGFALTLATLVTVVIHIMRG